MIGFSVTPGKPAPVTSIAGRRRQQGASLLEVLISVLILGIGMLGIAALQATALRNSQSSLEQSQAVIQTYAMFDAMRVNREAAIAGAYNGELCDVPAAAGDLVSGDLRRWMQSVTDSLGEGSCGTIACIGDDCTITVEWDDSRASEGGADGVTAGLSDRQTVTRTRI